MAETGLYLLKLSFTPPAGVTGAGNMTLAVTVNAVTGAVSGQALGTILEGTQSPQNFVAHVQGAMHSTGLGPVVKVGAVHGEAAVSLTPPQIGTYLAPFTASFALDSGWTGQGQFTVGQHIYKSEVKMID